MTTVEAFFIVGAILFTSSETKEVGGYCWLAGLGLYLFKAFGS